MDGPFGDRGRRPGPGVVRGRRPPGARRGGVRGDPHGRRRGAGPDHDRQRKRHVRCGRRHGELVAHRERHLQRHGSAHPRPGGAGRERGRARDARGFGSAHRHPHGQLHPARRGSFGHHPGRPAPAHAVGAGLRERAHERRRRSDQHGPRRSSRRGDSRADPIEEFASSCRRPSVQAGWPRRRWGPASAARGSLPSRAVRRRVCGP